MALEKLSDVVRAIEGRSRMPPYHTGAVRARRRRIESHRSASGTRLSSGKAMISFDGEMKANVSVRGTNIQPLTMAWAPCMPSIRKPANGPPNTPASTAADMKMPITRPRYATGSHVLK